MDMYLTLIQLLDSTVRLATPLLLACLAGLYSERAGIFDIGLEGKMLAPAKANCVGVLDPVAETFAAIRLDYRLRLAACGLGPCLPTVELRA